MQNGRKKLVTVVVAYVGLGILLVLFLPVVAVLDWVWQWILDHLLPR